MTFTKSIYPILSYFETAHLWNVTTSILFSDKKKSVLPRSLASFLSSIHKLSKGERERKDDCILRAQLFSELIASSYVPWEELQAKTLSFFMLGRWCAHFWSVWTFHKFSFSINSPLLFSLVMGWWLEIAFLLNDSIREICPGKKVCKTRFFKKLILWQALHNFAPNLA